MIVDLSFGELRAAAYAGIDRNVRAWAKGRVATFNQQRNWQDDIWGAIGECVVAKALGLYWPCGSPGLDRGGDVGPYHVRTVDRPDKHLLLHPDDLDDAKHLLVACLGATRFRVAGWIYGNEGKVDRYWQTFTGRPAYFVPASQLHPFDAMLAPTP